MLISLTGPGPLPQQIYRGIRDLILAGKLGAGARLPVTRQLAQELGVSRNVVLIAYEELFAAGYVTARTGSGTYVSTSVRNGSQLPPNQNGDGQPRAAALSRYARKLRKRPASLLAARAALPYDFDLDAASPEDFPSALWRKLTSQRCQRPVVGYIDPAGDPGLRDALAAHLKITRGVECDSSQIVIVNGSAQAVDLTARLLLDEGDVVVLEDPHYRGARDAFVAAGARLHAIPTDEHGMLTGELPRRPKSAKLAYVTPSHQYPSGGILSLERRLALLKWSARTGAYIVEDDYDSEYLYGQRPLETLQGIDRGERVIYIGTFSRALSPAIRLGYLVLPKPLVPLFVRAKHLADAHSAVLTQQVLSDFISRGYFERHIRKCRARKAELRAALLASIEQRLGAKAKVRGDHSGTHLMLSLAFPARQIDRLCAAAAHRGLGIYSARPFYLNPPARSELVMGYGALTADKIAAGVGILSDLLANWPLAAKRIGSCYAPIPPLF